MQITPRFSGNFKTDRKILDQIRSQKYTDISHVVNAHRTTTDEPFPCDIQLKKWMAWTHMPGNEYLEFRTDPFSDEVKKKLEDAGFKYMQGVRYKTPTLKWHKVKEFFPKYMRFSESFADALKSPSPWVSPYMIHRDDATEYYVKAKDGFTTLLITEGAQKIPLSQGVKVWMDRRKKLTVRIPAPGGVLIREWTYQPFNPLHVMFKAILPCLPEPKERSVLDFLQKHLLFAHAADQDFKKIKKPPTPEPEPEPEAKAKGKAKPEAKTKDKSEEAKPDTNQASTSGTKPVEIPYPDYPSMLNEAYWQYHLFGDVYKGEEYR